MTKNWRIKYQTWIKYQKHMGFVWGSWLWFQFQFCHFVMSFAHNTGSRNILHTVHMAKVLTFWTLSNALVSHCMPPLQLFSRLVFHFWLLSCWTIVRIITLITWLISLSVSVVCYHSTSTEIAGNDFTASAHFRSLSDLQEVVNLQEEIRHCQSGHEIQSDVLKTTLGK